MGTREENVHKALCSEEALGKKWEPKVFEVQLGADRWWLVGRRGGSNDNGH